MVTEISPERLDELIRLHDESVVDHFEQPGFFPLQEPLDVSLALRELRRRRRESSAKREERKEPLTKEPDRD